MNLVLTKNFYSWMRTVLLGTSATIASSTTNANGLFANNTSLIEPMIDSTGAEINAITFSSTYCGHNATLNFWATGAVSGTNFQIGNNNTSATENDYDLSGGYVVNTDYSVIHRAISNPQMVNGKGVLAFSVTFNAINPVTIGEIGVFKELEITSSLKKQVLFGRVALETPISLSAGESATFQISIEI